MAEIINHLTRLALVVPLLILLSPIMGKRAMSDVHLMDFLLVAATAEASAIAVIDTTRPLIPALVTITALGLIYWLFSVITLKWDPFRHAIFRGPSVLVEKGRIRREGLTQSRLSVDTLMAMLRAKDAYSVADVEFAVLEEDGQLSVMRKPELQPVTRKDMKIRTNSTDLMVAVVVDGSPINSALDYLGLDEEWLRQNLEGEGITNLESTLLVMANKKGDLQVAKVT